MDRQSTDGVPAGCCIHPAGDRNGRDEAPVDRLTVGALDFQINEIAPSLAATAHVKAKVGFVRSGRLVIFRMV